MRALNQLTLHVLVLAQLGTSPYSLQLVIVDHTGVLTGTNPSMPEKTIVYNSSL